MAQVFFPSYSFLTIKACVNLLLSLKKTKEKKRGGYKYCCSTGIQVTASQSDVNISNGSTGLDKTGLKLHSHKSEGLFAAAGVSKTVLTSFHLVQG